MTKLRHGRAGGKIGFNSHDRHPQDHYVRLAMRHSVRTIAEFIAAFLAIILLVLSVVIWRLNQGPINSTFLTPYIETGIERYIPGAHAQLAHSMLTWDNVDHSLALHTDGLVIKNAQNAVIGEVPNLDIRLSLLGLMVGQFWPIELTIDHPQFKLNRHADGRLYFASLSTGRDDAADNDGNSREILKQAMHNLSRAYAMRHMTVFRAAIAIHDEATNRDWAVSIPEISLMRTFMQLVGSAKIELTQKSETSTLELHYDYDHKKDLHRFSTRFKDITPAQLAGGHPETLGLDAASMVDLPLSGEMEVAFDPELDVAASAVTLHGGEGKLLIPSMWDKSRFIKNFDVEGDFDRKAHKLNLVTAAFDFGGAKMNLTASGHAPVDAKKYDLDFTMKAVLENWPMNGSADLWPKPVVANAREWMVGHLANGVYEKSEATFNGSLAWNDLANLAVTSGQGTISASHGDVTYIDGMPPVQGVHVDATFDLNHMDMALSDGGIGNLKIQPFTATITGLSDVDQFIDIPLKLSGPVPEIIKLIDYRPLGYASKVGLTPDSLSGSAEGVVNLHFPLIKALDTKDIDVTATAALSNIASTKLVKGVDISQGQLDLKLDKDNFTVKGTAALFKLPFQVSVQQFFQPAIAKPRRNVSVSGQINNDQWKLLGDTFAGTNGSAMLDLQMTELYKAKTALAGILDFAATDLRFSPLNWRKPVNMPATVQFDGEMPEGRDMVLKSISLRSPQAFAQGKAVISGDGVIKSLNLQPMKVGRTSANISMTQLDGEEGVLHFDVSGKSLDISGLKSDTNSDTSSARTKEYRLKVDKLFTSSNGVIARAEGYAVQDDKGWKAISLHGLADGEHQLSVELTPKEDGTRSFLMTCDDFGKMLKGLGLTDTVKEGDVRIEGSSTLDHPRQIDGTVRIGSFTVGKLPVLALLLNATSPFGFSGLVTDSASFSHMVGAFRWTANEIELKHINAAGTSVGMNISGKIDTKSNQANLHGTLVPFSMVNSFLGSIPLLGDILTGGDGGGVLAVAYDIKGSLSDPKIGVNPVSLLAPGFLRNLFFGDSSDDEE